MGKFESLIKVLHEIGTTAEKRGLVHQYVDDEVLNGRTISIDGKRLLHFGSCSYLGLEMDERMKAGGIEAIRKYGTKFSSSRSYLSCANYKEFENLLEQMFEAPILLATSTGNAHHVVMPIVMECDDCVIFDHQAHYSMRDLESKLNANKTFTTVLRHSRMDDLEERIIEYRHKYRRIWYVVDGVYSMYGDFAPIKKIVNLLDKYKQFYLYADDAHGMSWAGKHGTGYTLSQTHLHPKMILITSTNKAFAAGGGVIVFPDTELRDKVRNWGGPNTHSGPLQPANMGVGIASAKIHLSDEIYELQNSLQEKIAFTNHILEQYKLPIASNSEGPIFFLGLGLTRVGYNMLRRMMNDGVYCNLGIFPAVPENCTGMRFTITNHLKLEDIETLAKKAAYHLPKALQEEGRSMDDIYKAFRKVIRIEGRGEIHKTPKETIAAVAYDALPVERYTSIRQINQQEWDSHTGLNSACDYANLLFLEEVFSNNPEQENNWEFFYYIIRNTAGKVLLTTFFTSCLMKDDMLASAAVSEKIEKERESNPYYLTSKTFVMGSSLTEGQHLWLDKTHPHWQQILVSLLDEVWREQERLCASTLMLRDFHEDDAQLREFFMDHGFIKMDTDDNNIVPNETHQSRDDFYTQLLDSKKKRYVFRNDVLKDAELLDISVTRCDKDEVPMYYQLYKNVKTNKLSLNTFDLPIKLFYRMCESDHWEVIKIVRKETNTLVSVGLCGKNAQHNYCPTIIGMDYSVPDSLNVYKKMLHQAVCRGLDLQVDRICLGLSSSPAKHKLGAQTVKQVAYLQIKDHYNMELIRIMEKNI